MTLAAYPLVPKDEVGFRVQLTAANTDAEVDSLIAALERLAAAGELRTRERDAGGRRLMLAAPRLDLLPRGRSACSSASTCSRRRSRAAARS